ncbi:MAG: DUF5683 domain-containing protein [Bacteroidota bacterium]
MKLILSLLSLFLFFLLLPVYASAQADTVVIKSDTTIIIPDTVPVSEVHVGKLHRRSLLIGDTIPAETPDSIREKEHSPTKATLMSTFLPGLGQFYNKKYWKIPIIYAGFGVLGYFVFSYANEYTTYKNAYLESINGVTDGKYSSYVKQYSADQLLASRDFYRRNLEINCIFSVLWYAINILDAAVDAHLYTFNITDRLSMKVEPEPLQFTGFSCRPSSGLKLSLHF